MTKQPDPACPLCEGTGRICTGTSESEADGNVPIIEPCYLCVDV